MQMMMNIKSFLSSFSQVQNTQVIQTLLRSGVVTLEVLLDNDAELLHELRSGNKELIQFFNASVLEQVVAYLITNPTIDEYSKGHKFPFICNELMSVEVPEILNVFFLESQLLDRLFSFLDERPFNLTLSGYFCSALEALLRHNSYELISYIHDTRDAGRRITEHLYSTSVMKLVYKLLSCEDHGNPAYVDKLYEMVDFIAQNLMNVNELSESYGLMQIKNSAELLMNLLENHNEVYNWSDIQLQLCEPANIEALIKLSYCGESDGAAAAASVICALLKNLDVKNNEEEITSNELPLIVDLLCNNMKNYSETIFENTENVGLKRLGIINIISYCLKLHFPDIKSAIIEGKVLMHIIDLIPKFPWNSFLHNIIGELAAYIFLNDDNDVKCEVKNIQLINNTNLIQIIIEASRVRSSSIGYLGTVTKIANIILKFPGDSIKKSLEWQEFVDNFLLMKNKSENCTLGEGVFLKIKQEKPEEEEKYYDALQEPENIIYYDCTDQNTCEGFNINQPD